MELQRRGSGFVLPVSGEHITSIADHGAVRFSDTAGSVLTIDGEATVHHASTLAPVVVRGRDPAPRQAGRGTDP